MTAAPPIPEQGHAQLVAAYGAAQRRAVLAAEHQAARWWAALDTGDLSGSWLRRVGPALVRLLTAAQLLAAGPAQAYVDGMVRADGLEPQYDAGASRVSARALTGVAADGRPLDSLLYTPVIRTKTLLGGGVTLPEAMLAGQMQLRRIVASETADAGSGAFGVAVAANRTVTGYVRMVRAGACSRCAILAGRWYRYDADFDRHKRCQCYGVPSTSARRGRTTDPMSFFHGLSRAEQDRRFTIGGARAIRDGADIYSVVNASRSVTTLDAYGQRVVATLEGTTSRGSFYRQMRAEAEQRTGQRFARVAADLERGLPRFRLRTPRLMPGEIYRLAQSRDDIIRLLRRFGYLT
ncbi:hypothetical protein [Streptomyces sp. NBC_01477]|uniref:hypothetical protein n=1 Tax=Streptomyces sp. NBC_01477 TaxID=2976015 RepID=UPI002E36EA56|nr:hypothetical protein [Streptomyces sp. NBC_01477]